MNVAAAIARILKAEGTEYLFCFPVNALIDECARDRHPARSWPGPSGRW